MKKQFEYDENYQSLNRVTRLSHRIVVITVPLDHQIETIIQNRVAAIRVSSVPICGQKNLCQPTSNSPTPNNKPAL